MDTDWLKDFLCLVGTRSFSQAAKERGLSQPAFSRRIQALEAWLGVALIDRESNPPTLTSAGRTFRGFAETLLRQLQQARELLVGRREKPERELHFAVAFTLSLTYFPDWSAGVQEALTETNVKMSEMNTMDGSHALTRGDVDLLVCYHHPQIPVLLDLDRYPYVLIDIEYMRPYATCDDHGAPRYQFPGTPDNPIPFLSYAPDTFFVHVVDMILLNSPQPYYVQHRFQSHMAESLKEMILAGHGVGWLPQRCVTREMREKRVAVAGSAKWTTPLEIRLYRSAESRRPVVDRLWDYVVKQQANKTSERMAAPAITQTDRPKSAADRTMTSLRSTKTKPTTRMS